MDIQSSRLLARLTPPSPTLYFHCYNCRTLLSYPRSATEIQCSKCLAIMDPPQSGGNYPSAWDGFVASK